MKDYETYSNLKVPKSSKIILRLDGRRFHNLSKKLNLKKPYDIHFSKSMVEVATDIFKEFSPLLIYTFSDEINVLLSEIPFSARIEKLNSVFPSLASSSLTLHLQKNFIIKNQTLSDLEIKLLNKDINLDFLVSFDSRIIPVAIEDVFTYFKWRQDEAWRNYVNSYGYWALREDLSKKEATEKMRTLKSSDIHQFLFSKKGINLSKKPNWEKRGIAIYKKKKFIKGINPITKKEESSIRNILFVDEELSIFDESFFKDIGII
ncbi:MAG: guanylyltransferase [Methanobacteriaceae archaeon]|jgi:tRNA(His) 5'-end guanylyltransferase|nr:guanylyltransferase [Candidatus Methanorudis spinitermitis]